MFFSSPYLLSMCTNIFLPSLSPSSLLRIRFPANRYFTLSRITLQLLSHPKYLKTRRCFCTAREEEKFARTRLISKQVDCMHIRTQSAGGKNERRKVAREASISRGAGKVVFSVEVESRRSFPLPSRPLARYSTFANNKFNGPHETRRVRSDV